jgi:hypothetical protein
MSVTAAMTMTTMTEIIVAMALMMITASPRVATIRRAKLR